MSDPYVPVLRGPNSCLPIGYDSRPIYSRPSRGPVRVSLAVSVWQTDTPMRYTAYSHNQTSTTMVVRLGQTDYPTLVQSTVQVRTPEETQKTYSTQGMMPLPGLEI